MREGRAIGWLLDHLLLLLPCRSALCACTSLAVPEARRRRGVDSPFRTMSPPLSGFLLQFAFPARPHSAEGTSQHGLCGVHSRLLVFLSVFLSFPLLPITPTECGKQEMVSAFLPALSVASKCSCVVLSSYRLTTNFCFRTSYAFLLSVGLAFPSRFPPLLCLEGRPWCGALRRSGAQRLTRRGY